MLTDDAFAFIEDLDRRQDLLSLLDAFQALIRKFGFQSYFIGDPSQPHILREGRVWATTRPEGWIKRYAEQRYQLVDPVLRRMTVSAEPFRWSDVRATATPAARKLFEDASAFGLNDGFALSVYGAEGSAIGISVGGEHYALGPQDEASLRVAAIYFQEKFASLRQRPDAPAKVAKLTPRERECLSWVASGKTDWEISQILNISEQTTHEYVQNALSKLNAATRAQAVAVAMLTRQILL